MRHQKVGRKFGLRTGPRKRMLLNLADSFLLHEQVRTTKAKAKEVVKITERFIEISKKGDLAAIRHLRKSLPELTVKKLIEVFGPQFKQRKGGYTRILKLYQRKGDAAEIVLVSFVEDLGKAESEEEKTERKEKKGNKEVAEKKESNSAPKDVGATLDKKPVKKATVKSVNKTTSKTAKKTSNTKEKKTNS